MRHARNYIQAEMCARSALLFRYGRGQFGGRWRFYSQKFVSPEEGVYAVHSYGAHFPCAVAFFAGPPRGDANPRVTFFNADGYSRTTARHMGIVYRVFGGGRSGQTILANQTVMRELIDALLQANASSTSSFAAVREAFIARAHISRKQKELDEYNAGLHRAISRIIQSQPPDMRHALLRANMDEANFRLLRTTPTV